MDALEFARRIRNREQAVGYWVVLDDPIATERLARIGYDYVAVDAQHGLLGYTGIRDAMLAIDAGATSAAMVRVEQNDPFAIGRVLDAGATGVIVPLIDNAEDAAAAVRSTRYPPHGRRSYGPMRAQLRVGPTPAVSDEATLVLAMIETPEGLANVDEICATPGLDGVYVGPSDLRLAVGGATSTDPAVDGPFEEAVEKIAKAAEKAGIAAGIHNPSGEAARRRLAQGYTFASVACDLVHLEQAARSHLAAARDDR
ncbi:HpcH/HpaI aldolase family protein [Actinoalloteichus hymeniacidonis]|uniref:2,4-dihydroxyhept-2-ene-1,7-dioic acid aldolase n=1 Tax=Actinoalloteichus hymeniacidonis TaxID=340345 RepID=A0AAC9HKS0_9PSEU|nr:aldolase/citrate lyase family protein [Actinoalloteichus hymeniacidonis]AOS61030.1 2,4-dihydroxyhept-2-ene-1,7-dioic acid aldolase [Actinoalloteichus hymeniacidonis]MBB5910970.1 4-hydroxy-2-oxoheptanedioate aldolase [Actinoalloteichus hymeniacidonis]